MIKRRYFRQDHGDNSGSSSSSSSDCDSDNDLAEEAVSSEEVEEQEEEEAVKEESGEEEEGELEQQIVEGTDNMLLLDEFNVFNTNVILNAKRFRIPK
ncbi:hypothetical protein Zm00014a_043552 [Zea mays]|uniref:Uncharacterized protein n=2 Tax=Zea mays TaxID=4577 RepID=A0A3L6DYC9_MAIZE|nr:hypothetical protein Zm00014a_043552 [Zea mays]PWZ13681.1 hypothetical protein Zm00014a_043552 [Zea mays]